VARPARAIEQPPGRSQEANGNVRPRWMVARGPVARPSLDRIRLSGRLRDLGPRREAGTLLMYEPGGSLRATTTRRLE
jgi:hypothetical protein